MVLALFAMACVELEPVGPPWAPTSSLEEVTDTYVQPLEVPLDVLFVLDAGPEAEADREGVGDHVPFFLGSLLDGGIDYHIGVTTTDERVLREALGRRYVTPRTQRPIERLRALIELESAGDGVSRGFDAISGVIEAEASEADPWRRPDADLEVILITRSDDRSDVEANEFADWFDGLAGRGVRARVSGAVPGVAISYRRVIDGTGGVAAGPGPVLGGFFQEVTEDLEAVGLRTAFFLSRVPVLETLRVEVAEPAPRHGVLPEPGAGARDPAGGGGGARAPARRSS